MRCAVCFVILSGCGLLLGQRTPEPGDVSVLNNQIAKDIAELQGDFPPGTTDTTTKMGPNPGGGCYIEITVTSKNDPAAVRSIVIAFVNDHFCMNYILQKETGGFIKLIPKVNPVLTELQDLVKFFEVLGQLGGGKHERQSQPSSQPVQKAHAHPQLAAHQQGDTGQGFPDVLPLPFTPPFSTGVIVNSSNGCDPSQTYLYFRVNHFDNSVTRYDGCPPQITATIPISAPGPLQAALTPDNTTLVVTSYNQGITFINTATNQITKTLTTDPSVFPSGITMRYDGSMAYVTSLINNVPQVLVLDIANQQIVGSIPIAGIFPHSVYFSPDGTVAMVTCPFANFVFVIDVLTSTVSTAIEIGDPRDIAFNPSGTRAYVSSGIYPSSIKVVDTSTFEVIDSYPVNGYPGYIHISDDARDLTVTDLDSSNMFFIDLVTRNTVTIASKILGGGLASAP